ncbi:YDG/SRA domain-containing protein [Colletotrichum abscissum]|uniref:YDG/SRA domain-containing protein n=1 Tax=Colletotrichum abscissum TaxID=1671311 RepID=UPI0027D50F7B|nr:YDG/SRA domain-containing protein [Colletotrichum abscissum]KAK1486143.1 YDG/SRA domain-containing protein [Colletotrichum abscissum]
MQLPTDIAISTCRLTTTKACAAIETSQKSMRTIEPLLSLLACLKPSNNRRGINEVGACYPGLAFGVTWETTTTPRASRSLIPALESPCPPKNLSQLSAMWYGGHGESNAGISYMRGPNGEPGPVISIIMADKYSDIDVDRGDDIVYCGSNSLDNTSSNTPADGGPPVRAPSIIMADKYSDIDVDRGDGIIYCGSNSLDNTSSNTPADGGPPVRGNAALFKPTEKNIRLVRICSKNPERMRALPLFEELYLAQLPGETFGSRYAIKRKLEIIKRFPPEGRSGKQHRVFTSPVRDISAYLLFSNDQVVGGYLQDLPDLEDLPDLDDLDAHLRDPSSFAFTGAEQSINFHTSFEGMPPNVFQDGVTNATPPLAYGPATGHAAMWIFYTVKHGEHERDHEQLRSHG